MAAFLPDLRFAPSNGFSRRDVLRLSTAGTLTASLPWFDALRAHAEGGTGAAAGGVPARGTAQRCILLWLGGGPSQAHSFDPRRGEHVGVIETSVPDIEFSEYLPRLAQRAHRLALLKTMNHPNFGHGDAVIWMQTGFKNKDGGVDRPSLGSIVTHAIGRRDAELPNYVVIDPSDAEGLFSMNGGHLGPAFNPLKVLPGRPIPDVRPAGPGGAAGAGDEALAARTALLERMNSAFLAHNHSDTAAGHQNSLAAALRIMRTPKIKAFDLDEEPAAVREAYGKGRMGDSCLLARRLIEAGVPFVSAHVRDGLGNGWDTHMDAPARNQVQFEGLDRCFAALLDDLVDRGLLDSTLVICMGEFGRSRDGVNHNNKMWTAVLAGGGLRTGQAIGDTGPDGRTLVSGGPIRPADLFATVLHALGIDHAADYTVRGNRPLGIVGPGAKLVEELF